MKLIIKTPAELGAARAASEAQTARAEALAYLARTDWMVIRANETGTPVPEDIAFARADARHRANANE